MASTRQSEDAHYDDSGDVTMHNVDEHGLSFTTPLRADFTSQGDDDDLLANHQRGMVFDGNGNVDGHCLEVRQRHLMEHLRNVEQSVNNYPGHGQVIVQGPHGVNFCPPNLPSFGTGATLHPQSPLAAAPLLGKYHSSTGSVEGDQSLTDYTSSWGGSTWPNNSNFNNNNSSKSDDGNYMPGNVLGPGPSLTPLGSPRFPDPANCSFFPAGTPSAGESYIYHPQAMPQRGDPTSAAASPRDIIPLGWSEEPQSVPAFSPQPLYEPSGLSPPPPPEGVGWNPHIYLSQSEAGVVDPAITQPSHNPLGHRPPSAAAGEMSTTWASPPQTSNLTVSSFLEPPTTPIHSPSSPAQSTANGPPSITLSPAPETSVNQKATPRSTPQRRGRRDKRSSRTPHSARRNRRGHAVDEPRFECVFAPFGCDSVFWAKNEWKRHALTIHLQLFTYDCDLGDCANPGTTSPIRYSPATTDHAATQGVSHAAAAAATHKKFNRTDLFSQHVCRMHSPWGQNYTPTPDAKARFKADVTTPALHRCCERLRHPPSRTRCPYCGDEFASWNERMEHVAPHIDNGDPVVFEDTPLIDWAVGEGIIRDDGAGFVLASCAGKKRRKS